MILVNFFSDKLIILKILAVFFFITILYIFVTYNDTLYYGSLNEEKLVDYYFLPLNEADSTIIKTKNHTIIIDMGEKDDYDIINQKISELEIETIDYLILTHPDKDHIGGAENLINSYTIRNIYQANYNKKSNLQASLNKTIINKSLNNTIVIEEINIEVDNLQIQIIPGSEDTYKTDNDYSLVVIVSQGQRRFFLGGDIEAERIQEIININPGHADVVKQPHHGRYNYLSLNLLDILKPKYVIVTSESANKKIIELLNKIHSKVFYTPGGEIHLRSDGYVIAEEQKS